MIETKYIEFPNVWQARYMIFDYCEIHVALPNVLRGSLLESLHRRDGLGMERSPRMRGFDPWSGVVLTDIYWQLFCQTLGNRCRGKRVPRVLGDDHYKRMSRVTVGVTRLLKNPHCSIAMSVEYRSKSVHLNSDVSKWVKISSGT